MARITAAQFRSQVARARKQWPFIAEVERKHGLPAGFLLAVGSRETNLTNVIGDGGHGFGVWQRDNRWWPVNRSYLNNVRKQAEDAATLLKANYRALGNWKSAAAAYNAGLTAVKRALAAGRSADSATTGRDYGADVMQRLSYIQPATKQQRKAVTVARSKSTGYLQDLAAIARRTGFPVVEQPGWRSRGHGSFRGVRSVIAHHDAANQGARTFNTVIQNGHGSLSGPLSQFALRRDGTIHVVAAGVAWHAGSNINDALYGNYYSIGIEAGNNGVGERWPQRQLDAYVALCAELAKAFGLSADRVRGHKEIAPSRKIDPAGINMTWFRSRVRQRMNQGGGPAAPSKPKTPEDEAHMKVLPKGGKLKPGGATKLAYTTVAFDPNYAHCLTIAPGVGCGVHIAGINTWKNQPKKARQGRYGRSVKEPGGVGALAKNEWIHEHSAGSYYVPKGVAKVDIAYATESEGTIGVFRR